jgi:hypothetical protein
MIIGADNILKIVKIMSHKTLLYFTALPAGNSKFSVFFSMKLGIPYFAHKDIIIILYPVAKKICTILNNYSPL